MSAPVILRPYQEQMRQAWLAARDRGIQRGLIVAATGTGKTTVFWSILDMYNQYSRAFSGMILAHRQELLSQAMQRGRAQCPHITVAIESGDSKASIGTQVVCASVQSVGVESSTRLDWLGPQIVVCDEGHHGAAKTYQNTFRRFGCYQEGGTDLLGVTATPHRLDQLALYGSERAIFQEVVYTYDIVQAIKDGFLVDLRGFRAAADIDLSKVKDFQGDYALGQLEKAMNTAPITELAFKSWSEVASDRQTIIFCSGVDHAKDVAKVFGEHGIKAEAIYGEMNPSLRQAAIARFQKGETQILTNMDILTEGFDAQHCACVILLRPTKSWSLFVQMVGRGLRTLPNIIEGIGEPILRRSAISQSKKPDCLVIDIVSNTSAHSLTGKPESKDIPSLAGIVGLPSALDMEGLSVAQAVEQFESLPDMLKAAAWRGRNTSFSGLTATLTQVEMLSELAVPEEVEEAGARLHWLKTGDLEYLLDIGNEIGSPISRKAILTGDIIGNWTLRMMAFDHERTFRDECRHIESVDTRELFRIAEQMIKSCFPGVSRSADAKAPWRTGKPTASQILDLKAFGITDDAINELNKGQASAMLNMLERRQQGGS